MSDLKPAKTTEMAPDPDEDDLSDLDDMLDEFSAKKTEDTKATVNKKDTTSTEEAPNHDGEDFAKQLQAGMEELLGQFGANSDMQSELEQMMKELSRTAAEGATAGTSSGNATTATVTNGTAATAGVKKSGEESFQDTIKKTMERMQNSGDSASAAASTSNEEDMLAQMMKQLGGGEFPGMDGNEEDFNKMLMGMMEQLTNKDILYEPMKDLYEKYPEWMEQNKDKTKPEDLARYKQQQSIVTEIVARFQRSGYSDDNQEDREYIVERMQKMQAAGSPPPDLVGDMGSAQEMFSEMDGGCPTQ